MNNIKKILKQKNISINKLAESIELTYSATHHLVNRKDLLSTPLGTLLSVAKALDVDEKELYSK